MQREEKRGLTLRAKSLSPSEGSAAKQRLVNQRKIGRKVLTMNSKDIRYFQELLDEPVGWIRDLDKSLFD
jgi:hypothetical protein